MSINVEGSQLVSQIISLLDVRSDFLTPDTIDSVFKGIQETTDFSNAKDVMRGAVQLAFWSVLHNGGPFGAVIVNNGDCVSYGANHVVKHSDPTDHGEVNALRRALGMGRQDKLKGATLFTSTYPCPMCYGLAIDSGIETIVYCNTEADAEMHGGFNDQLFWREVQRLDTVDQKSSHQYGMDGTVIVVRDEGQPLDRVLRAYCKTNGVEPEELTFDPCGKVLVLSLYEFTALRWAGVQVPSTVKLQHFKMPELIHRSDFQLVGQQVFQLFEKMGSLYGQKRD